MFTRSPVNKEAYPKRSRFRRLQGPHKTWMFSAFLEEPPRENGMMWSKASSSSAPQSTHCPPARRMASAFTSFGIWRVLRRRARLSSASRLAAAAFSRFSSR